MTTNAETQQTLFIVSKDNNTGDVKRIAATGDLQIGVVGKAAELCLLGKLAINATKFNATSTSFTYRMNIHDTALAVNRVSTPSGSINIYLPPAPRAGQVVLIKDSSGTANSTSIVVQTTNNETIDNNVTLSLTTAYAAVLLVYLDGNWQTLAAGAGGSGAPTNATYVVISNDATLTNERALAVASGQLTLTDGGANNNVTLGLANTTVTPGSYTNANISVDQQGRITTAANGSSAGAGDPGAQYVVLANTASLSNERALVISTGLKSIDAGANSSYTLSINDNVVATVSGTTFTGATVHSAGLSGSLTQLADGTSYLRAGSNVTITSSSSGFITISSIGGDSLLTQSITTGIVASTAVQTFYYTSGTQYFTVPSNVSAITAHLWGAGGGAGVGGIGGAGGFTSGTILVSSGEQLIIAVGGGGGSPSSAYGTRGLGGYFGGGDGANGDPGTLKNAGGGGGGYSGIFTGSIAHINAILIAGAGGGGVGNNQAGSGGGLSGSNGAGGAIGYGGTQYYGGAASNSSSLPPEAGSALQGGSVPAATGGGGGGAGYYGGGCNYFVNSTGGGGSGYHHPTKTTLSGTLNGASTNTVGTGTLPAQTTNIYYVTSVGTGALDLTQGGPGLVVLTWVIEPVSSKSIVFSTSSFAVTDATHLPSTTIGFGADTYFYVSGTIGITGASAKKSLFVGDTHISGTLSVNQGITGSLTRLNDGTSYLRAGANVAIETGSNGSITISGLNPGDITATYLVLTNTASLSNERALTPGTGIRGTDAGANSTYTLSINDSVVATVSGTTFTGPALFSAGVSGSMQRTVTGLPYLVPSGGIQITTQSSGQISLYVPIGTAAGTTLSPRGFVDRTHSSMSFNPVTEVLTIGPAPGRTSYQIVQDGTLYTLTGTYNLSISASYSAAGNYFVSYAHPIFFATLGGPRSFAHPTVAAVYLQSTSGSFGFADERHGTVMDWVTHEYLHRTIGTRYASGFTATRIATGAGAVDGDAQISLTDGTIYDEDIRHDIVRSATPTGSYDQELGLSTSIPGKIPVHYVSGPGTVWYKDTSTNFPCRTTDNTTATRLAYNSITSGTGSLAQPSDNDWCVYWIVATNSFFEPIISVMGQSDYATLSAAQNASFSTMVLGNLPFTEFKLLYKLIYRTRNVYANSVNAAIVEIQDLRQASLLPGTFSSVDHSSLTGLTTPGAHPASAISTIVTNFTNNLSSVDVSVQNALDTLDDHQHGIFTGSITILGGLTASIGLLPSGQTLFAGGNQISIVTGSTGQITISSTATSADLGAQYLVLANTASLSSERAFTPGTGLLGTDAGANSTYTLAINNNVVATVSGTTFTGTTLHNAGLSGSLTKLTDGSSYILAGTNVTVTTGSNGSITISSSGGSGSGADTAATYIVVSSTSSLPNERVLTAGSGISITDSGAGNSIVISATAGGSSNGTFSRRIDPDTNDLLVWRLNEPSGSTYYYSSGSAGNFPLTGSSEIFAASSMFFGNAVGIDPPGTTTLYASGSNSAHPTGSNNNTFTYSTWIYLKSWYTTFAKIITKSYNATTWSAPFYNGLGFISTDGRFELAAINASGTGYFVGSYNREVGKVPLNEWCHLGGTVSGSQVKLFLNGRLCGSGSITGDVRWGNYASEPEGDGWCVGTNIKAVGETTDSYMTDVRIAKVARDENWFRDTYANGIGYFTGAIGTTGNSGDSAAQYLVLSATSSLSNERVLTLGTSLSASDNGSGGNYTLNVNPTLAHVENDVVYLGTGSVSGSVFADSFFGQRVSVTPSLLATGTIAASGTLSITSSLSVGKRYTYTAETWGETASDGFVYAKGLLVKAHMSASTAFIVVNKALDDDYSSTGCTFVCTSSAGNVIFTFTNGSASTLSSHIAVGWYEVNKP